MSLIEGMPDGVTGSLHSIVGEGIPAGVHRTQLAMRSAAELCQFWPGWANGSERAAALYLHLVGSIQPNGSKDCQQYARAEHGRELLAIRVHSRVCNGTIHPEFVSKQRGGRSATCGKR